MRGFSKADVQQKRFVLGAAGDTRREHRPAPPLLPAHRHERDEGAGDA